MSVDEIRTSSELPPPEVKEVADRIFCYLQADGSWGLNNAGFVVGRRGATVIDTCFTERRTRSFIDAIRGSNQAAAPNSDQYPSSRGPHPRQLPVPGLHRLWPTNCAAKPVLEAGLPKPDNPIGMLFPNVDWGNLELAAPTLTYQDKMTLYVEDLRLELIFMGPAHTTNDTVVWLPDLKAAVFRRSDIQRRDTVCCHGVGGRVSGGRREAQSPGPRDHSPGPRACVRPGAFRPYRGLPEVRSGCCLGGV